jgi:hypothetical protein
MKIPDPTTLDIKEWAKRIVGYLRDLEAGTETPAPKIIQLEHTKTGAKATTDGVIMWSPVDGTVLVSKGGDWYKVTIVAGGTP